MSLEQAVGSVAVALLFVAMAVLDVARELRKVREWLERKGQL